MKSYIRPVWAITIGTFYAFFLFGFTDNLKGATLPDLLKNLDFSYSLGGTILLGAYAGFFMATLLTGMLSDVAGKKSVLYVAGSALLLGITGYALSSTPLLLIASMIVLGVGLGSLEVSGNIIIVDIHNKDKGKYLNLLSFFHGLGSMLAPFYASQLLDSGFSWRSVYQFSLILVVFLPLYFVFIKYPKTISSESNKIDLQRLQKKAFTPQMLWFYTLILFYVASEVGIGSWLVEFLQSSKGQTVIQSSLFLSLYFGTMTVGRFIGSFIVSRIGYLRIMLYCTMAAIICIILGIWGPAVLTFLLPMTGLFFSIMFPTATAAVSDLHKDNAGTVLGLFFSFAGIGGMVGPWLIGILSDAADINFGLTIVLLYCFIVAISLIILLKNKFDNIYRNA